ncbi:uncharacterized protein NPIL_276001 [Nephila pilipes]|uniref:Uncharacterized protein n=1 Tax=Nephila pilipes TaxID=299642 RepID=A0A8X6QLQ7_NEPPI|nr:uncharacterized protein NPIL_276001 [Nephila pilipes]
MEELPSLKSFLSEEEEFCETHFKSTYKINDLGRFVVKLPIYKDINQLGETKDSQVVLSWLSSLPRNWKPFIANRTSEILDLIPQSRRRYVPTKKNPAADIGSRGVSPKDLSDYRLWWESPSFLSSPEAD